MAQTPKLLDVWETKVEGMFGGEVSVDAMENLVKAARVGGKAAIKVLVFKNTSKRGKIVLPIHMEPCDPYKKNGKTAEPKKDRW